MFPVVSKYRKDMICEDFACGSPIRDPESLLTWTSIAGPYRINSLLPIFKFELEMSVKYRNECIKEQKSKNKALSLKPKKKDLKISL